MRAQVEPGHVALSGTMNEGSDLAPLMKLPQPLVIDLAKLDRINSIGVRNWMDFVKQCDRAGTAPTIERCSPVIVGQMSMITTFMGKARVKSVNVPYFCPACRNEHEQLLELRPGADVQPSIPCPKCGAAMELDDLVEAYREVLRRS